VAQRVQRWIEVTPAQFTHEAEGLNLISALPLAAPGQLCLDAEWIDARPAVSAAEGTS
jgi:hypothetical protein